ncbi:hypothetical protein Aab01nite_21260 [Paractinoplanes abujensis]|uniref:Uncharacterized protein n=1 Tax=Paractinoplanes abujensis TaxID=882441 RepID=A0A7W7CYH6_9ACTN|nr:hypothetical protein [Actinoplanes abujensis]MBB4696992.1 hypothetical protein [Actinoplanes abujensis]GID18536.1 hypothetical protein Aab01nite_21260 [Actinoplanes abujensis]
MRIPARFNGPPTSGNGGWSAGAFAAAAGARIGGPALEVTLRVPPPLDTTLTYADGSVRDGDTLVATVTEAAGDIPAVAPVEPATAVTAAEAYEGFTHHPFPTCYVCGPEREDGLRIFSGPLPDGRTAAPWVVPAGADLTVLWAALDCPGGWTALRSGRTYVLGRIAVAADALPEPGSTCVVVGEAIEFSGRKATVLSTLYDPCSVPLARARATWIATN